MQKAIIHTATGEFRDPQGRFLIEGRSQGWTEAGCPAPTDPAYSLINLPEGVEPDRVRHRYDPATGGVRLTTSQELSAITDAEVAQQAERTSRQKDAMTTLAYIVRRTNVAAWNAMTPAEKRAAVMTQADIWRDLRVMAEKLW